MTPCDWTHACDRRAAGAAMSPADWTHDASVAVCVVHALDARLNHWTVRRLRGAPSRAGWSMAEDLVCSCTAPVTAADGTCAACSREVITVSLIRATHDAGWEPEARAFARVERRQDLQRTRLAGVA